MDERGPPDPLKDLGARIDKAYGPRADTGKDPGRQARNSGRDLSMGMRIGLELVVGVVVGVGIGYLLDRWLGTKPWLMVGGFFLGVAAGMVNVYRTVTGIGMAAGYRGKGPSPSSGPTKIGTRIDVAAESSPLHQFTIEPIYPIHIGGIDASFTNSALLMVLTVVIVTAFLVLSTGGGAAGPDPAPIGGGAFLRIHRQHGAGECRGRGQALFPVPLHALHVRAAGQSPGHGPRGASPSPATSSSPSRWPPSCSSASR